METRLGEDMEAEILYLSERWLFGLRENYQTPGQPDPIQEQGRGHGGSPMVPVGVSSTQPQSSPAVQAEAHSTLGRPLPRPGYGTLGISRTVKANHFQVKVGTNDFHHYHVKIFEDSKVNPPLTNKKKCRVIVAQLCRKYRESHLGGRMIAYDGGNGLYTGGLLPFTSQQFTVNLDGDDGESSFRVEIQYVAKRCDSPQITIQALAVILKEQPASIYEAVGRSFFSRLLGDPGELSRGVVCWRGYYQSLRQTEMGFSLIIDTLGTSFYRPILVIDLINKLILGGLERKLPIHAQIILQRVFNGLKVEFDFEGKRLSSKISELSHQPLRQLTFTDKTGSKKSVLQYFLHKHKLSLEYTWLPAIQCDNVEVGWIPMEICKISEGQRYRLKLSRKQLKNMLNTTCQRPENRHDSITQMVRSNDYDNTPLVNEEFKIKVLPELASIKARVLPRPMLKYQVSGRPSEFCPLSSQWNMKDKKMIYGAKVEFWTAVSFSSSDIDIVDFCKDLIGMCHTIGMVRC